ncbi:MAG TPA: heterodisulfide reductase-related iron-sulfur binding cluster, partial [Gammaproteobacteria bacterium]|nr:heterodisulfide reductase-related iron-sulfur binding cluster [Gammaproteobacteria bacterium]
MQTRFSATQLADPDVAASEQILRKCVHCGFCTATCPTYVLLGDELDSPRGRIYLIKEMLENDRPATADVVRHVDRCLSCLACMTTCPSGVHYQHLIDHARVHVERTYRRPPVDRALRALLAWTLPYPRRFRAALALAALARPFAAVLPRRVRAMLELTGRWAGAARSVRDTSVSSARGASGVSPAGSAAVSRAASPDIRRARVALVTGCVQTVLDPEINAATIRLLERAGAEVVSVAGCCGSIVHHLGREPASHALAAALIERLHRELEAGLDAIVVNASGCGTQLKDYGYMFRNDAALAAKSAAVSAKTRDVTEALAELGLPPRARGGAPTVAYHSACSMQHGQKLDALPRQLLRDAGFEVREIAEGHLCCGSAGTYNVLQPEIAAQLRDRKLASIGRTGAEL